MDRILEFANGHELPKDASPSGVAPLSIQEFENHTADRHFVLAKPSGSMEARCSVWWTNVPAYSGERLGVIGHYAAASRSSSYRLLQHACARLAEQGCTMAVGPMDGSTWRRYRLITERSDEPPFFLEPDNPDDWPQQFYAAGFLALASYSSALNTDLSREDPRVPQIEARLRDSGVRIRPLNMRDIEADLRQIFTLSLASFQRNFLYTPIGFDEFIEQYKKILPYVAPGLVFLAEEEDRLVGFLFVLPDLCQAQRGQEIDTIIVKTVAVQPGRRYAGLGTLMVALCHKEARRVGYSRAINALMHDANHSRNMSDWYGHTIRRYTLFKRHL